MWMTQNPWTFLITSESLALAVPYLLHEIVSEIDQFAFQRLEIMDVYNWRFGSKSMNWKHSRTNFYPHLNN